MSKHPDLNGTALALLRALDRGEVRGIRVLSERAAGRPLCGAVDLAVMREYLGETRHLIDRGYLSRKPAGTSIRLSLTRKGRRALHPGTPFWPAPVTWALGASMLAAGVTGCAPMPPEQPRVLLMGAPVLTGLAQVRDPQTGTDYFVPCNPCAAPTPKTPMLGSTDAAPEATGKAAARPQPSVLAKLDAHTVATLAIPAEADAIPAGSAQLTDDVRPVTVVAVGPATAAPVAATASSSLRSLPFSSSVANLNDEAKRNLSELLPLAMTAERVLIRGRTDSTGTVAGNRALAIARAATVRAAFVRGGVDPRKLKVSYCVTCFVASNDTEAGRSANRRVEVELVMPAPAVAFSK